MWGWKWISIMALSAAVAVGCGAATARPAPTETHAPTETLAPTEATSPTATPAANLTATPSPTPTPARGDQMTADPILAQLAAQARTDLARRLALSPDSIRLKQAAAVEWPDSSLGCPRPGFMYSQVITAGYLVVLEAGGKEYEYHSDGQRIFLCVK